MSQLIDRPFETWQSTVFFVVVVAMLGSVAVFLGVRYLEALRFKRYDCCANPLTLEGQRSKGDPQQRAPEDVIPESAYVDSQGHYNSDIRPRYRAGHIRPSTVGIGEVRQGRIAQRRASASRKVISLNE